MPSYHPPTKLWEGIIFTGVCHFVQDWGSHVTITMMHWTSLYTPRHRTPWTWDLTVQGPLCQTQSAHHPRHGTSLYRDTPPPIPCPCASDIWWPSLDTRSNLITSGLPPPSQKKHLLVAIEACMVGTSTRYASYWNAFLQCFILKNR